MPASSSPMLSRAISHAILRAILVESVEPGCGAFGNSWSTAVAYPAYGFVTFRLIATVGVRGTTANPTYPVFPGLPLIAAPPARVWRRRSRCVESRWQRLPHGYCRWCGESETRSPELGRSSRSWATGAEGRSTERALGRRVSIDGIGHWRVFCQCFRKKLDGEGPGSALLALVVDPAVHAIHTLYQACDDQAGEHVLERALGWEAVFFDEV